MFNANPALKIAFLSHNEVDAIEDSLLQNKSELKRVDLGDNGFESVGDIFEVNIPYDSYNMSHIMKVFQSKLTSFAPSFHWESRKEGASDVNFH